MPPHWTSDPRHFSSLTCDLQKLLSTFQKLEKLIIKWIRWEGRAGGAKVFTWMISPFTWNTAPCNFPPLKGVNFPQDEPITRSWCMIDVIQRLMKMKQMFLNRNIHLVSSFLSRRAGFHPARWRKKKKKKRCFERLMKITSFNVWEVIYSAEQRKHISSNQTPNTDANLINGHSVMLLTWPRRSRSCSDVPD